MAKSRLLDESICKWSKKDLEKYFDFYVEEILGTPRYVCAKCGRAAQRRRNLCKSRKIVGGKVLRLRSA